MKAKQEKTHTHLYTLQRKHKQKKRKEVKKIFQNLMFEFLS